MLSNLQNVLVQRTECFECGKLGHIARSCPNKQSRLGGRFSAGVCLLCGRVGHDASTCFRDYDIQDFKVLLLFHGYEYSSLQDLSSYCVK